MIVQIAQLGYKCTLQLIYTCKPKANEVAVLFMNISKLNWTLCISIGASYHVLDLTSNSLAALEMMEITNNNNVLVLQTL